MSDIMEKSIRIRLTDSQSEVLQSLCDQTGKNKSEVVRQLLDERGGSTKPEISTDERIEFMRAAGNLVTEVNKLTTAVNKQGTNINQIAKRLNAGGSVNSDLIDVLENIIRNNASIRNNVQRELMKIWESLG